MERKKRKMCKWKSGEDKIKKIRKNERKPSKAWVEVIDDFSIPKDPINRSFLRLLFPHHVIRSSKSSTPQQILSQKNVLYCDINAIFTSNSPTSLSMFFTLLQTNDKKFSRNDWDNANEKALEKRMIKLVKNSEVLRVEWVRLSCRKFKPAKGTYKFMLC
jgi:hypothetical protein